MTDTLAPARPLPLSALPEGAAQPQLPQQAHISAVGIEDPATGLLAHAVLRQRRTAEVIQVVGWDAPAPLSAALARGVEAEARARGALALRATPEQGQAIAALGLADTGRGYAQRWLDAPIPLPRDVGLYNQSTGFTCGPVSLAMALGPVTRAQEIAIWREATTMIGLTGPGGCDPYGMMLACARRGLDVTLHFDSADPILLERATDPDKRELMCFVQAQFKADVLAAGLPVVPAHLSLTGLTEALRSGAMVILLIDQVLTHDHHAPHWVLVHAERDGVFLVNDPWLEPRDRETLADVDCLPIRGPVLHAMGAYGTPVCHAALILR